MAIFNQVVKGGGSTPTGTISITSNGTHDVTNYATADVNVPTTAPAHYIEMSVGVNGKMEKSNNFINLSGVLDLGSYALTYAYRGTNLSGVIDFVDLTEMTGEYCLHNTFSGCSGITGVSFSKVQRITGNQAMASICYDCRNLTGNLDLSSLVYIGGTGGAEMSQAFYSCNITSVDFKNLETIASYTTFSDCFAKNVNLATLQFQSLKSIPQNNVMGNIVKGSTAFQSFWFYALNTNSFGNKNQQFRNMCSGTTGVTVHFPMAIQSTIGSWSDVTNGFGGTNTTVLFDLVTSLTGADGNTYTRQEKDSTSTATAWVYNDTLYYTSGVSNNGHGVNEPSVSDAIYSDAACTQSVTTITAIA